MIVPSDPDYFDTKLVKQGIKQLDPIFKKLAEWINQNYNTKVLNIYYDKIKVDKNRPRLNIIFEYYRDAVKFRDSIGNFDSRKQLEIAERFKFILSGKYNYSIASQLEMKDATRFDIENLLVIFDEFERVARDEANMEIPQEEIENLRREIAMNEIWEIYREFSVTTIFFLTDIQLQKFSTDGTTQHIKIKYFNLLKKYDEFDYIKVDTNYLVFDTKENFDQKFKSNWFYYSRR